MKTFTTAGIIIIGNEILSGRVHDTNAQFIADELWNLGIMLQRIVVIPDEEETIGEISTEFSKTYTYVFTSGGIGPTHDDVTVAGIAKGFGVRLICHPLLEEFLRRHYGESIKKAALKMALIPEGAEIIGLEAKRYPLIYFRNIFIFPGIPEYLRSKFGLIRDMIRGTAFRIRTIYLDAQESDIADTLSQIVRQYPEIEFGSYPVIGNPDYKVYITATSRSSGLLEKAEVDLLSLLPKSTVVKIT